MAIKYQRGVAMMVVVWMIMLMMTLAASLLYATRTLSNTVDYARRMADARAIADAATNYSVLQLFLPNKERDLLIGGTPLTWQYAGATVEIRVIGENGLIDINYANRELLKRILETAGLKNQEVDRWLDLIEDFRDVDNLKRLHGAEDDDYAKEGLAFGAKDAPIERIEELQQILGMTPAIYQILTHYLTVSSGSAGINPMLAPRHVLLLLADGDNAKVDAYLKEREKAAAEGQTVQPDFGEAFLDYSQQPRYRLQIKVLQDDKDSAYFEERSIQLAPGKMPPFFNYFRILQQSSAQFG